MNEELLDWLDQVRHDLARYVRLPVAWLPADAHEAEQRKALRQALRETRQVGDGVQSARALWDALRTQAPAGAEALAGWPDLEAAVAVVLSFDARLDEEAPVDRAAYLAATAELNQVLAAWMEEVDDDA